jgi:ribosome recycling factor
VHAPTFPSFQPARHGLSDTAFRRAPDESKFRADANEGDEGDEIGMGILEDVQKEILTNISKAHDALKRELSKLRAGRANPSLLDGIRVDYYGTPTPLAQMAHINVPEARMLTVKPWDKTAMKAVEKAIREADLGLNPQPDGDILRVPLPPLTEERRREFVKIAKKYGEECKVTIRKARHDAIDMLNQISADGDASEDEVERAKKKIEESVAEGGKQVETLVAHKEKDILEV